MDKDYYLYLYEKALPDCMELKEKILFSLDAGYDGLEICIDMDRKRLNRLKWSEKTLEDLNTFLINNQIHLKTLSFSGLRGNTLGQLNKERNREAIKMVESALNICKTLGIEILLINAYDVYYEASTLETRKRFGENLSKIVALAEKNKIIIGLENAEKEFADTASKVNKWVKKFNSDYLKIYYDSANAYNAFYGNHEKVIKDFEASKYNICAAHLKDSIIGEYRLTPYGEGHVQFDKIIPIQKNNGIKTFTAELFYDSKKDWMQYTNYVQQFLTKYLKER